MKSMLGMSSIICINSGALKWPSPHQDMRVREMVTKPHEHAAHDHGFLGAGGAFAGAQHSGNERAEDAVKDYQRQIAGAAVMVVVTRQRLLAIDRIFRMVKVD